MAKDKSSKDKPKKEKRDKSLSKQSADGVGKSSKREKQSSISPEHADRLLQEVENNAGSTNNSTSVPSIARTSHDATVDADHSMVDASNNSTSTRPLGALVPFANPLADEKTAKKVFKSVKKANKAKSLKRGVKEVVKTLRKSPLATPSSMSSTSTPIGVVVIAADISPMDVISHLPVLCEDHGVPYVYVSSRAELGAAGQTKRPTSVVLVGKDQGKVKASKEKEDGEKEKEEWSETYSELVKVVRRAGRDVRV